MAYGNRPGMDPDPTIEELAQTKTRALDSRRVPCRHCGAKADEPCHNAVNDQPLRKFTAHPIRMTDARNLAPIADDEELF